MKIIMKIPTILSITVIPSTVTFDFPEWIPGPLPEWGCGGIPR